MTEVEKKDDSIEKDSVKETEESQSDVGLEEKKDEEVVEEKVEEKPKADEDVVPRAEYERLLKEKKDLDVVYGRQANELGQMRRQVPPPKQERELTAEEKLNLFATDPNKYEAYVVNKAKQEALQEFKSYSRVNEVERDLQMKYPDLKNTESDLFKKTREVMFENPQVYRYDTYGRPLYNPDALKLAAEIATGRMSSPEDLINKGREEAKNNINVKTREVSMETKGASPASGGGSKAEDLLGRPLKEREQKFLDKLGLSIDDLAEEVNYATVKKGGKK